MISKYSNRFEILAFMDTIKDKKLKDLGLLIVEKLDERYRARNSINYDDTTLLARSAGDELLKLMEEFDILYAEYTKPIELPLPKIGDLE